MDSFLPRYDDPIVSILLLLGIIFVVALLSYAYSIWKQEQSAKELMGFIKNFDSNECLLDTQNLQFEESMKKPLFLLALSYKKSGEYSKAISLYLYLLKHTKDSSILSNLAFAYFKAGFLQRARDVYLEIISKKPRNKEALYMLEFIYEKLNDYENALDALNVLEAQGEEVSALKLHLKYQEINKSFLSKEEKFEKLEMLLENSGRYRADIVRKLFILEPKKAWRYYKEEYFEKLIDILDKLDKDSIDLDIIAKQVSLKQLFFIKGFIETCEEKSGIWALNILSAAKSCGVQSGELKFIYTCKKCKNSYPLPFSRCPNCHRVYSFNIGVDIEQKREKSDYSLQ